MRRAENQHAKIERLRAGGGLILIESPYIRVRPVTACSRWLPSLLFFPFTYPLLLHTIGLDVSNEQNAFSARARITSMMDSEIDPSTASA